MVARCDEVLASSARRPADTSLAAAADDVPEPLHTPVPGVAAPARVPSGPLGLAAWAAARLVSSLRRRPLRQSTAGTLTIAVHGEVLARIDGLFARARRRQAVPAEVKRFRGQGHRQALRRRGATA